MVNITYRDALVIEGTIMRTQFRAVLEYVRMECPSCWEPITFALWDQSPLGHDACGVICKNVGCWHCEAQTEIHVHEGCIISMSTRDGGSRVNEWDEQERFERFFAEGPSVGAKSGEWPVGARWNHIEGRPNTPAEMNPEWNSEIDDIPF